MSRQFLPICILNHVCIVSDVIVSFNLGLIFSQSPEELKIFMDTYDKLKIDQEANEIVKQGIEADKDSDEGPVRVLIDPRDMTKYYVEKMKDIIEQLDKLNRLLI